MKKEVKKHIPLMHEMVENYLKTIRDNTNRLISQSAVNNGKAFRIVDLNLETNIQTSKYFLEDGRELTISTDHSGHLIVADCSLENKKQWKIKGINSRISRRRFSKDCVLVTLYDGERVSKNACIPALIYPKLIKSYCGIDITEGKEDIR